ncbi:EamA family transporter [Neisseria sp. Ec49-e6-T10]|uniref:EamA family transporter n=1 Tax=Neisseria sp. Ec49-e6-T10 TaxID=3140744 RepID=UPI003EBE3361
MNNLIIILWIANISFDTLGQIAFKYAATKPTTAPNKSILSYWYGLCRQPWLWVGIASYLIEFLLWLAFLTLVPLSEGILLGSVNIIAIMIVGRILFNEKLTPMRVVGILCVTAGVAVVGVG